MARAAAQHGAQLVGRVHDTQLAAQEGMSGRVKAVIGRGGVWLALGGQSCHRAPGPLQLASMV
jgi:hypothetical protein